jgi:TolB-like protein
MLFFEKLTLKFSGDWTGTSPVFTSYCERLSRMPEGIINTRLSNLTQIVVRPTSSILKYVDVNRDPVAVASELKVDFVVSRSLQQASKQVRVTVQMVSPNEQRPVWADHFEEAFTHVFSVEDSISGRVATALVLKLSAAQRESLVRRDTESREAYELYFRGR